MKQKIFYGWVIVFGCMLLAASSTGLLSYLSPLFVMPVTEELGISRATFMVYQTFSTVATAVGMPLISSVYKKVPMKVMIIAGACLGAASQLCYSFAPSVGWFYLGGMMSGTANCLFGAIPIAILTSNWFYEKKGTATGIAFAGTGLVSALLSPVMSKVIGQYGWRMGYRVIAVLILVIVVPTALFLVRETPQEMGLEPLGAQKTADGVFEKTGFSRKQVFRTASFWMFVAVVFMIGFLTMPTQQQLVAYWTDIGNDATFAATLYSVMMLVATAAKVLLGGIYDRTSVDKATLIVGVLSVLSYVGLVVFPKNYAAVVPAALFGITVAVQVLATTYVVNRLFGDKEYAFIYSILTPVLYAGVGVGSPSSAALYDVFGGYRSVWLVFAALYTLAIALLLAADAMSKKEYRKILGIERR